MDERRDKLRKKIYLYVGLISFFCIIFQIIFYFGYIGKKQNKLQETRIESNDREDKKAMSVDSNSQVVLKPNARFLCDYYDQSTKKKWQEEGMIADVFIGWSRKEIQDYLRDYLKTPPKEEEEKGLKGYELVSFSSDSIQMQKMYESKSKYQFLLVVENNEVVIYDEKWENQYEKTGISTERLSEKEKNKLMKGIYVKDEKELYSILEDYSS